jgi:hypothetical protein
VSGLTIAKRKLEVLVGTRAVQKSVVTVTLAVAAALICSGCPALTIPGLAYSGYKYEHDKNQPAAAASASTSQSSSKSTASQQKKIPDSDIE